jgi:RimJ/RimL family protein N-acetyltransferase
VILPAEVQTERLLLRQWREEDVEPLAEIYAQPEYLEFMGTQDAPGRIARFQRQWNEVGFSHWAVEELTSGFLIGRIGLMRHFDWPLAEAPVEVGWALHRDWWGRGLATEGGRAAVECWREHLLEDEQLLSIALPANVQSRAVMERLGLTYRGTADWHGFEHVWWAVDRAP